MKTLKFAFVITLPVFFGYIFMGIACGLLLKEAGYNAIWAFFTSVFVYAGSGQFLLTGLLSQGVSALQAASMQLSLNSRHFFYGISLFQKFKGMGKKFFYMVFALTDETYSILCTAKIPAELNPHKTYFYIALLNHIYWVVGCVAGALLGDVIPFSTKGIEFAMTALFVVILTEQCMLKAPRVPAIIGAVCAVLALIIFGKSSFILPALILSVGILIIFKKPLSKVKEAV